MKETRNETELEEAHRRCFAHDLTFAVEGFGHGVERLPVDLQTIECEHHVLHHGNALVGAGKLQCPRLACIGETERVVLQEIGACTEIECHAVDRNGHTHVPDARARRHRSDVGRRKHLRGQSVHARTRRSDPNGHRHTCGRDTREQFTHSFA